MCFDSVEHVVLALAMNEGNGQFPSGYGSACVRHFEKRSEQIADIFNRGISVESRFALIEVTSVASINHNWSDSREPRTAQASYKEYLRQAAQLAGVAHLGSEQWQHVVGFALDSMASTPITIRNIAYALVWCGYFTPDRFVSDRQLARHFFRENRSKFIRSRQEGLRLLAMLREFSIRPFMGGVS